MSFEEKIKVIDNNILDLTKEISKLYSESIEKKKHARFCSIISMLILTTILFAPVSSWILFVLAVIGTIGYFHYITDYAYYAGRITTLAIVAKKLTKDL